MRGIQIGTVLLTLTGCPQGGTPPPTTVPTTDTAPDDPQPAGSASGQRGASGSDCVSLVEVRVVDDAYARGLTALGESRDGEHYLSGPFEESMGALKIAAEQGHRAAQSLYGRTLFQVRFMNQAPVDEEREDYVSAFAFLRIAGLRGDAEAKDFLPDMLGEQVPSRDEPPFEQIPAEWMTAAFERADVWMACHGQTVGDRGVPSAPAEAAAP